MADHEQPRVDPARRGDHRQVAGVVVGGRDEADRVGQAGLRQHVRVGAVAGHLWRAGRRGVAGDRFDHGHREPQDAVLDRAGVGPDRPGYRGSMALTALAPICPYPAKG
jgi:hypothetical protein